MTKVHILPPTRKAASSDSRRAFRVSYHTVSVLLNVVFVVNLASTPLLAYISEPFPWSESWRAQDDPQTAEALDSMHTSVMTTLRSVYNNLTMPDDVVCLNNDATSSHVARRILAIVPASALENAPFQQFNILVSFPGAIFYGAGIREFIYDFLAANDTTRQTARWSRCQHVRFLTILMSEACTWIEPHVETAARVAANSSRPVESTAPARFIVYHGVVRFEAASWSWFKLVYRVLLTLYVLWTVWSKYYRHVRTLYAQLETLGLMGASACTHFCILVGDPTALVVSSPVVAAVMVFDIWINPVFLSMAAMRVGQFTDPYMFLWGWMYSSRNMWCAFLAMQLLTRLIKRWKVEAKFCPVDPVVLTIAAYCYGGPVVTMCATTPAMVMFHLNWGHFVPAAEKFEAIECLVGLIVVSSLMSSLPILYSATLAHRRRTARGPALLAASSSTRVMQNRHADDSVFSHIAFNDLKLKVLYSWTLPPVIRNATRRPVATGDANTSVVYRRRGGSLHRLVHDNARVVGRWFRFHCAVRYAPSTTLSLELVVDAGLAAV
ncbi:hypothetical protein, variant [Aphanomyces invadans]|uniref:Uncharacterized protein n=1 Tax=Aphanomyces invadans TaxID=157072 RepID=A0A024TBU3_9STRA|nr:hypothetical protein, variant [Aphanomyces invadans]ETV91635.1 hypothetical protein, variant [Aphanomyces invadans]|eukprot:XP_008879754.1 hypothetical protein, variant [Aphanomyces invadans]